MSASVWDELEDMTLSEPAMLVAAIKQAKELKLTEVTVKGQISGDSWCALQKKGYRLDFEANGNTVISFSMGLCDVSGGKVSVQPPTTTIQAKGGITREWSLMEQREQARLNRIPK